MNFQTIPNRILGSFRRHRSQTILACLILLDLAFIWWLFLHDATGWRTNVAFLILGALASVFTTLLSEAGRRETLKRDLAVALYVELADRAARCCIDMERRWKQYFDTRNCQSANVNVVTLRKFTPEDPLVFPSVAGQIALLGTDAARAMVRFYYRLTAWRRDIDAVASSGLLSSGYVHPEFLRSLAGRLRETVIPALDALKILSSIVEEHESIEASAIAAYDFGRPEATIPPGTLRERLENLVK